MRLETLLLTPLYEGSIEICSSHQLDGLIIALIFVLDESKDDIEFSQFGFIIGREVSRAKSVF